MAAILGLGACADPEERFEEFGERTGPAPAAGCEVAVPCDPPAPGVIDGDFLFAISAVVNRTAPVVFTAKVTTTEASGGGTEINMVFQPLKYSDRRTPVTFDPGDPRTHPVDIGTHPIQADSSWAIDLPLLTISGEANPITKDAAITAQVSFCGQICATGGPGADTKPDSGPAAVAPDFYCGNASGNVISPTEIDLAGSAYTMRRLSSLEPASLPDDVEIDCQHGLALPP